MKKIILLFGILLTTNVHAADYYFDFTLGSNSNQASFSCSQANPCKDFTGTTLDNAGALSAGDRILLKAGESWCGSNVAEWAIASNGTAGNPIVVTRYGTGANPKIGGSCVTTPTWTSAGGGIYYTTGQTQGTIKSVTVDDDNSSTRYGLNRVGVNTSINNNALPAGSFCRAASTTAGQPCTYVSGTGSNLFVRLSDGSDPTGHNIRIGSYTHNSGNGDRGLVRTTTNSSYGYYVDFIDIDIVHSNGIGFSASGNGVRTGYLNIFGVARDGYLRYCSTSSNEDGSYGADFGSTVSWSALNGRGQGQNITDYCNNNAYFDTITHHGMMAGFDTLDLGTTTDVSNILTKRMQAYYNGLDYDSGSFDGNIYNDGGHDIVHMDAISYGTGVQSSGGGANARWGFLSGSERPTTDPADDVYWMNVLSYGNNGLALEMNNPTTSTAAMGEHYIWGSTLIAVITGAGSTDRVYGFSDFPASADIVSIKKNIVRGNSSANVINATTAIAITNSSLNSNENMYSRIGGNTSVLKINGVDKTLAQWQSDTSEDASSTVNNPNFTSEADATMDVHLQAGSPAIDACGTNTGYTVPSDIVTAFSGMFPTASSKLIGRGTTQADGTLDDPSTALDCGFHYNYGYIYPANIEPRSFTELAVGTVDVSFTLSDSAIPYNGVIKVTFPSGFVLNSGGTTAISSVTGMNGTFTLGASGQVLTITRVGDGYSTMPQEITFSLSNIKNPSAGTSGSYLIETYKSDGTTKIATSAAEYGLSINGDTFTNAISPHAQLSGPFRIEGVIYFT